MIDFKKKLGSSSMGKKINPIEIYNSLDRASDKGPLRPAQETILKDWFSNHMDKKDVILKLHTGQGKTLIGLLILQSKLNQGKGPVIYLCPNSYLIQQTKEQAKQFGIRAVVAEDDLPLNFLDGKNILITSVQKLFNGLTKFGLNNKSLHIDSMVMDDAHACIEAIRSTFIVKIKSTENAYNEILQLFAQELEDQGVGTFADIKNREYDSFLYVPYWAWTKKHQEVASILANHNTEKHIKFQWPLLKDIIKDCQCIISGDSLEISPYLNPIEMFGSYHKAEHRVFMSATVNDDSFFIKTLSVDPAIIKKPLMLKKEKWSGEKMILIPEMIDDTLDRTQIVNHFGKSKKSRKYGVVVLTPSGKRAELWEKCGATVATTDTIDSEIEILKSGKGEKTLVIVNRYDGIDLPDHSCRLLIMDSKPHSETLSDRYQESCRAESDIVSIKIAQKVEQGLGRGVRGEKDYCAIIITDGELARAIKRKESQKYFSNQTRTQIEIGFQIAEYAVDEIKAKGKDPIQGLTELLNQSLLRDDGWKDFYIEKMDEMEEGADTKKVLELLKVEKEAEQKYKNGDALGAVTILQKLIASPLVTNESEKGWYLQESARYMFSEDPEKANELQRQAHSLNNFLLKPERGMVIKKINLIGQKRIENIKTWLKLQGDFQEVVLKLNEILGNLSFGVKADKFENALHELSSALGFIGERPDKQWKEGPDNLWTVRDNEYILFECKNEVKVTRVEINKDETKQMNNSIAWFKKQYGEVTVKNILIINANSFAKGAVLSKEVELMKEKHLKKLVKNVRAFFNEFKELDFSNLSDKKIQEYLTTHKLTVDDMKAEYSEKVK
jgi:replicative superfamily II helicase